MGLILRIDSDRFERFLAAGVGFVAGYPTSALEVCERPQADVNWYEFVRTAAETLLGTVQFLETCREQFLDQQVRDVGLDEGREDEQ